MLKKIAIVIPDLSAGGAERVSAMLANHWSGQGQDVTLVLFDDATKPQFHVVDSNIKVISLPGGDYGFFRRNLIRVISLRKFFKEYKPELIISMMTYVNIVVLLACWRAKRSAVVSERIDPEWDELPLTWRWLRRILYPSAAKLVVQTTRASDYFTPWLSSRVAVIPNPVDLSEFEGNDMPKNSRRIVSVGRLERQKGHDVTLSAFAALPQKLRDSCELVIYGEGSQRRMLEQQITRLGLGENVKLPGTTATIVSELMQAGVFVMSSRFEGFPNALVEAMAAGCAVISTDCPSGPSELINQGVNGRLLPVDDVCALCAALQVLLEDPEKQQELGQRAQIDIRGLALPDIAARWERLI